MAGIIRKRTWRTRKGETKSAWVANYPDQHGKWHLRHFATKREAATWLLQVQQVARTGPALLSIEDIKRLPSAQCGVYFLFFEGELQRIGQSMDIGKRLLAHRGNGVRFERFRPPHNRELRRAINRGNLAASVEEAV